jgi:hypothetical protein
MTHDIATREGKGVATTGPFPSDTPGLAKLRLLIDEAFSADDLDTFCFDHFPQVYNNFTAGQTKAARVRQLVEYANRQRLLDELISHAKQANPAVFERESLHQ